MDNVTATVYTLPDLRKLGSYGFSGATPGGPMVTAVSGDWVLLFDEDQLEVVVSIVWNIGTNATVRVVGSEPFAVGSDGSVLRRIVSPDGPPCYAYTQVTDLAHKTGRCAVTERPAGGVDSGALSSDGQWAALSVSNRVAPVLMRTSDLQAGRWSPIRLAPSSGTPIYWDSSGVVIGGDRSYRCSVTGQCTRLAIPSYATIVPRLGLSG
jgi:hypothetical protein